MKKIVFIRATNIYNDSRATKEIFALAEAGYNITVLGWNRNGEAEEGCKKLFFDIRDQVECWFYNQKLEKGIGLKNIGKLLKWFKWVKKSLKTMGLVSIVHACDLDSGLPAMKYCKRKKIKFVYDIFDYYIDTHVTIPKLLKNRIEKLEISVINKADITIICTEERREQLLKAKPKEVLVIHNSPQVDKLEWVESVWDYAYCGALNGRRLIEETFLNYEENKDLAFVFGGYGKYQDMALELAERNEKFTFLGSVPYAEVLKVEQQSRVLSAIYEPITRNHRLCAPNKFYEALALGKPLIVCKGTGIDKIVKENNIGCVIEYNVQQFYQALRILKSNPTLCQEMGERARNLYEKKYKWSIMKEKLLNCYSKL